MFFVRQKIKQSFVGFFQSVGDFSYLFCQKTSRNLQRHGVVEKIPQGRVRHVPASLEVRCQGRIPEIQQLRSEETGLFDLRRQLGGVKALATAAPIPGSAKFRNDEGFACEFDLLMNFRRFGGGNELAAAGRTGVELECNDMVDLLFGKGLSEMLFASLLGHSFSFRFLFCRSARAALEIQPVCRPDAHVLPQSRSVTEIGFRASLC